MNHARKEFIVYNVTFAMVAAFLTLPGLDSESWLKLVERHIQEAIGSMQTLEHVVLKTRK